MHRDRVRAESFGSVAHAYERYSPAFPAALIDDLVALGGTDVLDVGSGTGKVARELARRGRSVLGVEVDARMAAVAREHGVRVEVARFEDWDDHGRRFDLVTCGDAWHWIDPKRGAAAVSRVLRPGGAFVWFWNLQLLDDAVMDVLDVVYREHAPEVYAYGRLPEQRPPSPPPLVGPFAAIEERTYESERRVRGAEWAGFAETISDHQRLPAERRARLLDALRAAIDGVGETVRVRMVTAAYFARLERRAH